MRWILLPLAIVAAYLVFQSSEGSEGTLESAAPLIDASQDEAVLVDAAAAKGEPIATDATVQGRVSLEAVGTTQALDEIASDGAVGLVASKEAGELAGKVQFILSADSESTLGAAEYFVDWVEVGAAENSGRRDFGSDGAANVELAPGAYQCICTSPSGIRGPIVSFEVATGDEPIVVVLTAPTKFKLRTSVQDSATERPLSGVAVAVRRSDLADFGLAESDDLVTDVTGAIAFDSLSAGEWSFTMSLDGFAESQFTLELPGRWESQLEELGHIEFGALWMTPITPLEIALEGFGDWESGASGFRIASGPDEEPTTFDALGRGTMELGWLANPVYLKLFYPNEQRLGLYLDAGLPDAGEAIVIRVGHGQTLEIDVQASPEVEGLLDFAKSSFNVTGRTARGDSVTQGASVEGLGVYRVQGVAASAVTVSFSTVIPSAEEADPASGGRLTVVTSEDVTMKESGVTTCTLFIDSVPRRLLLKGESWQPSTTTFAEVRPRPDVTSWLHGNPVDDAGSILLPNLKGRPHSLRLADYEGRILAVDLPLVFTETEGLAEMAIRSPRPTRTRVLLDGAPAGGISVTYTGADSSAVCAVEVTDAEGWTPTWSVVEGSRLMAQPTVRDLWGAEVATAHPGGDMTINLRSTGLVRLPSALDPDGLRTADAAESLGDWIREGLVRDRSDQPAVREYRVPVGRYSFARSDGSPGTVEVRSSSTVTVVL